MPKISIYERDLTTVAIDNVTDNIVYIPGYAITGPTNTPVLCRTLDEFQRLFGELPYVFRSSYSYEAGFDELATPSTDFVIVEEYEKSYIMAAELLSNGLPVLYERVMSGTSETNFIASKSFGNLTVSAKYPGSYGSYIQCKVTAEGTDGETFRFCYLYNFVR